MRQYLFISCLILSVWQLSACTHLFFYPDESLALNPAVAQLHYEDIYIETAQGKLHGWWIPAQVASTDSKQSGEALAHNREAYAGSPAKGSVVFAHGNAGNMGSHLGFVYWLPKMGYNLLMFDYRGYGRSSGKPTAKGIVADTQAVLAYMQQRPEAAAGIVLYGHSLGGATGLSALAQWPDRAHIKGAIIDSAFANYRDIARDKLASHWLTVALYPLVPLLVTAQPDPAQLVAALAPLPLYISHSAGDRVIPLAHSQRLYARALPPKQFYPLKAQQHNHGWRHEADRRWFLRSLDSMLSTSPR